MGRGAGISSCGACGNIHITTDEFDGTGDIEVSRGKAGPYLGWCWYGQRV